MATGNSDKPLFLHLLYGADYNPDQWLDRPDVLEEDLRLMRLAHVNSVSLGIFAWAALEPEEGRYTFDWLDQTMERLHTNGVRVNLATPSGSKPAWMSLKYPEVRRVQPNGLRDPHGGRHNHCLTSPVYREKVRAVNERLAERYGKHPALQLWHVSNEYGGYCYCDLCMAAFRDWLRQRYSGDLDALNRAWWSAFWSHTITAWDQITAVDQNVHGMELDWKRFMTDQCITFLENEIAPLRRHSPHVPVTTNLMGTYDAYDYWRLAKPLDVVCWDSYPGWHGEQSDVDVACGVAFVHDINRALKGGKPWLLMETTPSVTNWHGVSRPRRPGLNRINGLQAVAHGSDGVLYFQWRKGRGGSEKFHGAIVDHVGHEHNRIFREVAELGADLERLESAVGSRVEAEVALIYDWENAWGIQQAKGPRNNDKAYRATCEAHYRPFWRRGIPVDVIDSTVELSGYRLLVAPMLYMLRPGAAERIGAFVERGGIFVATYLTGIVDEHDLCFLGGFPGPLRPVLGVWAEETDVLHDHQRQTVLPTPEGEVLGLRGVYVARQYCDVVHADTMEDGGRRTDGSGSVNRQPSPVSTGARVLATYGQDYYAGQPALTVKETAMGRAYYVASRNDARFCDDFLGALARELALRRAAPAVLPEGVSAQRRVAEDGRSWLFLLNFTPEEATVDLGTVAFSDALTCAPVAGSVTLHPYGGTVLTEGGAAE